MTGRFTRTVEDFSCVVCGAAVCGNGYTNHCPKCLHSRHVDVNPGDRAEKCGGTMIPIGAEQDHGELFLIHRCSSCGIERRIRRAEEDDFEQILLLMKGSRQ